MMAICRLRIAAFSGRIDAAQDLLPPVLEAAAVSERLAGVVGSVVGVVRGKADDHAALLATLEVADRVPAPPRDFVDRGVLRLLGYGLMAAGETALAAKVILRAADEHGLERSTLIDRALSIDLLVAVALEGDDLVSADTWLALLDPVLDHPVVAPTATRAWGRRHLAAGDVDLAIEFLTTSIELCAERGSQTEVADGEIVLARARIAARDVGSASRRLRALVEDSDRSGYGAVRRAAEEVLAPSGRRLPPVAGKEWSVLSAREAEVARLVLAGREVDEIAADLFLAPSTVRAHLSRVFHAFGVANRIGLLAAAGARSGPAEAPALSPRQADVVGLLAGGRSNQQIAEALGISVKGVEKHVGDVRLRWAARSRFDIARIWWSANTSEA
ncbi:helix-turn-helix transcriptional regulator [Nocardioides caeni]|uniref:Helix-turn-helix transcriptional regulator n=2 Tax=Nocardioides caeni TaxID=574700 RepID=A0A4S8N0A9_9ACTN|nr:helix-turn-helix transcriptional regulator [Nocardioides caeni]